MQLDANHLHVWFLFLLAKLLTLASVMLNDHGMYEHIMDDDIFLGVVGMLECAFFVVTSLTVDLNSNHR